LKKFIVLYHADSSAMEQMQNASPEDMKKGMEPWEAWAKKCGSYLVDMGTPLSGGQRLTASGSSPSEKNVVGYSVLQANTMEEAKALLDGHPHLGWAAGCEIEVHESMPLPD
jgi:hypothetical protein